MDGLDERSCRDCLAQARDGAPAEALSVAFSVVCTEQFRIEALAVEQTFHGDIADLGAVAGHGYPHQVIDIARAFLVERGTGRSHGNVLVAVDHVVVIVVKMPGNEGVVPILQLILNCLEAGRWPLPCRFVYSTCMT
jgi:hypothetical protein